MIVGDTEGHSHDVHSDIVLCTLLHVVFVVKNTELFTHKKHVALVTSDPLTLNQQGCKIWTQSGSDLPQMG